MHIPPHATVEQRARIYSDWLGQDVAMPVPFPTDGSDGVPEARLPGGEAQGQRRVIPLSRYLYGPRVTVDAENRATVYVRGPLDRFWGFDPQKMGEVLDRIAPVSITLDIATPGGLVEQALQTFADFQARQAAGVPVTARASGTVASAGVAMFSVASERTAATGAAFMAHAPYVALYAAVNRARLDGLRTEIHRALEVSESRMAATYRAAGINDDTIEAWHDGSDHWLTPDEAHASGLLTAAPDAAEPGEPAPVGDAGATDDNEAAMLPETARAELDGSLDAIWRPRYSG